MRGSVLVLLAVVAGAAVQAADAPLAANYGTEGGCAAEAGKRSTAGGESTVVTPKLVRYDGMICPITKVTDLGSQSWELGIACARGHDDEFPGTLKVVEMPAESLSVELVSGMGPKGDYAVCAP